MSKRDTYRDEPNWDNVSKAYAEERERRTVEQLMQPDTYERTRKCHGRTKHY